MNEIKNLVRGITYPLWHAWQECDSQLPKWERHRGLRLSVCALYALLVMAVTYFLLISTVVGAMHIFGVL